MAFMTTLVGFPHRQVLHGLPHRYGSRGIKKRLSSPRRARYNVVRRDGKGLGIEVELPGVDRDQVEVTCDENGNMVISATAKEQSKVREGRPGSEDVVKSSDGQTQETPVDRAASDEHREIKKKVTFQENEEHCADEKCTPIFRRKLKLPRHCDPSKIHGKVRDGMLFLTIPTRDDATAVNQPLVLE